MKKIIIDHVNNIEADEKAFHNELITLRTLAVGLFSLAGNTRQIEIELNKIEGLQFNMGTHLGGDARRTYMIACFFHWFANTVYNFARLVRYVDEINKGISFKTNEERKVFYNDYFRLVIPEILVWRNKVTAHFAKTDPRGENIATLEASVMYPVQFIKPYLRAAGLIWNSGGVRSDLPSWALTECSEGLNARYWPEFKLDTI